MQQPQFKRVDNGIQVTGTDKFSGQLYLHLIPRGPDGCKKQELETAWKSLTHRMLIREIVSQKKGQLRTDQEIVSLHKAVKEYGGGWESEAHSAAVRQAAQASFERRQREEQQVSEDSGLQLSPA